MSNLIQIKPQHMMNNCKVKPDRIEERSKYCFCLCVCGGVGVYMCVSIPLQPLAIGLC